KEPIKVMKWLARCRAASSEFRNSTQHLLRDTRIACNKACGPQEAAFNSPSAVAVKDLNDGIAP
ncbi:MAG: hypothetical protein ACI8PT_000378, partial [Gammaproteobacteria bacterium]